MNRLMGKEKPTSPSEMVSDKFREKVHMEVKRFENLFL